jgi:hypothetical protein
MESYSSKKEKGKKRKGGREEGREGGRKRIKHTLNNCNSVVNPPNTEKKAEGKELWEYNRGTELVQSILYASLE